MISQPWKHRSMRFSLFIAWMKFPRGTLATLLRSFDGSPTNVGEKQNIPGRKNETGEAFWVCHASSP